MTNTPFNKACFMISCGYGFMGSSTLQQQAIHLVFGTDEGMVREKASGIFAALTEGTNEFSHEILERPAVIPMKRPSWYARLWKLCGPSRFFRGAK